MRQAEFIFSGKVDLGNAYIIDVPANLTNKADLIDVYRSTGFPTYLAANWDSLSGCLRDLSWINTNEIFVVHHDVPLSGNDSASRAYLSVLKDAVTDWKAGGGHRLDVIFPEHCRADVLRLLDQNPTE